MADDDDFFDDDDLGDLPDNTLAQLEQQAVSSTQQHQQQQQHRSAPIASAVPLRKQAHNASSLNRGDAQNRNLPWRPQSSRQPTYHTHLVAAESAPPPSAPEPPSSDYGLDDEDVINLDEPSMVIQPSSRPRAVQPPLNGSRSWQKAPVDPEREAAFAAADAELGSQTFGRWPTDHEADQDRPPPGAFIDVSALQERIAELEAEQARLRRSEEEARSDIRAKQGEIAIVRSNQDKLTKQYEARLSVMQRLHADETAKAKADLESQRKERAKMETDNRFLQHDLAQESARVRRTNGPSRSRTAPTTTQRDTPRKSKRQALGDGFDDNEILIVSPSKSKEKTREGTPKIGAKRKRAVNDSPAAALSFTQPPQPIRHENSEQTTASFEQTPVEATVLPRDDKYEFMQLILSRTPYEGHARSVEALMKYSFPSKPEQSLASIFLDGIRSSTDLDSSLPLKTSRVLLKLWGRCLNERSFDGFYLVIDLLRFVLQTESSITKAQLVEEAVPLCSQCIEMIPVALGRASTNRAYAASHDRKALEKLASELQVDEIVRFIRDLCNSASLLTERIHVFWKAMDLHTVLILLNKFSPIEHIVIALRMLVTSVRPVTFGVIDENVGQAHSQEQSTIERLTNLLFEIPVPPGDEERYTNEEILKLRVEVLQVFRELCHTERGTQLIVDHRSAIGRLVRFLDAQVSKLYRVRPSLGQDDTRPNSHDLLAKCINITTRLLYHSLKSFGDASSINQKLRVVKGGYHKFVVSLTRIALSEQLVFEAGIEDEVAEAAHVIMDDFLGPEDGEAVMQAFETPRGTKVSPTEHNTTSRATQSNGCDTTMTDHG